MGIACCNFRGSLGSLGQSMVDGPTGDVSSLSTVVMVDDIQRLMIILQHLIELKTSDPICFSWAKMKMIDKMCILCFFPRILPKFLPHWLNQQKENWKNIASFNISCPVSRQVTEKMEELWQKGRQMLAQVGKNLIAIYQEIYEHFFFLGETGENQAGWWFQIFFYFHPYLGK